MLNRRGLITGLISFTAAAPAIVRAASLMPVKTMLPIQITGLVFPLVSASDYTPLTGAQVSGYISKDGSPYAVLTAPLVEIGNGLYEAKLSASDLSSKRTYLHFSADEADPVNMMLTSMGVN